MTENIEIEFKNMLTKIEYQMFLREFNISQDDIFSQQNHYFDTPQFDLKANASALRIRQKNNQFEMTLKEPASVGLLETNELISENEAREAMELNKLPEGKIRDIIEEKGIPFQEIVYFGSLSTNRSEIAFKEGLLVFDHNLYFNKEDYELEYEVNDYEKGNEAFLQLLRDYRVPERKTENKIRRFYNVMKMMRP